MNRRTDCLIVGFNETDFGEYVSWCRSMGEDTGAFRDVRLAFIEHEGRALHAMDALNRFSTAAPPGKHLISHGQTTDARDPGATLGCVLNRGQDRSGQGPSVPRRPNPGRSGFHS